MQQKQHRARMQVFTLLLAAVIVSGIVTLMTRDVPPPRHSIEKQLDAKAILEQK
ncbi:MAG: hypothetical protein KGI29_01735 [Pseudomonadota bacterium]|nr:hypothetical protein [Pseudomonadota bacterium]MDE3037635.1 hypothetical protein [Pseudomonadota bacterium]